MSGQAAAANTNAKPDAPAAASDAGSSAGASDSTATSTRLLEDTRSTSSSTSDSSSSGTGSSDRSTLPGDQATESGDVSSTAGENLRSEADNEFKSPDAKKLFNNAQMSASVMEQFGMPELVEGGEKKDDSSGIGDWFSNAVDWTSQKFVDNIYKPASEGLGSLLDTFGMSSDWMFQGENSGITTDLFAGTAPAAIASVNDVGRREYKETRTDAMDGFKYDFKPAEGLELPDNATADGTVDVGDTRMSIFRTPDGKTFLKKGDKVIAGQKPDGSFDLTLSDNTKANVRISKDGEQYKLDHLERFKDDRIQQRFADGIYYNYNYDSQGNRSVDATGDIQGPMSQQELDQRMEAIRRELGPDGTAALRFRQDGRSRRLMMQGHGENTHSITDIEQRRARIFHGGQEYRLNEHDQLGRVDSDGKWSQVDQSNKPEDTDTERLAELARRSDRRASGDGQTDVDGVKLEIKPDGEAVIHRHDTHTGEELSTTELPVDQGQPIKITNQQTGESTNLLGTNLELNNPFDERILSFDSDTGFNTNEFSLNENGLTDLETGLNMDQDGNVFDGDGLFLSGDAEGTDWYFPELDYNKAEHRENMETSRESSAMVNNLGSLSLSIARSGNPAAVGIARQVAAEALGIANSAISALGNDFLAQIPVYNSQGIAQTALNQAMREERTQTYAMRMGISDTTRLSEFNRIATLSSTTYSPEEYVRHRMNAA